MRLLVASVTLSVAFVRVFLKLVVRRPEGFDAVDDFFDLASVASTL